MISLRATADAPLLSSNSVLTSGFLGSNDVIVNRAAPLPASCGIVWLSNKPDCDYQGVELTFYGTGNDNDIGEARIWIVKWDNNPAGMPVEKDLSASGIGYYLGSVAVQLGTFTRTFPWNATSQRLADTLTLTRGNYATAFEGSRGSVFVYGSAANGSNRLFIKNAPGCDILVQMINSGSPATASLNCTFQMTT